MRRAQSRLTSSKKSSSRSNNFSSRKRTDKSKSRFNLFRLKFPRLNFSHAKFNLSCFKPYLQHWPTLLLALTFTAATYLILTRVSPASIRHVLLPNTYLPLLVTAFLAFWFGFSFILLNSRRGLFLSLALTTFLFLRLQQVEITRQAILVILGFFLGSELVFTLLNHLS